LATLATQSITRAGVVPSYAAAAGGGDAFTPTKDTWLHAKNGSGGSITVTIVTARTDAIGNAIADNAIAIAAGAEKLIGPFPAEHYQDSSTGLAAVTYSGVTSLTIGAFALAQP
jgi:hypothetical protein